MPKVLLFHHALGQTEGFAAFAFVGEGDIDAARELVESTEHAELFLYPGSEHYFADSSLSGYDPTAAMLLTQRVLAFLADRG